MADFRLWGRIEHTSPGMFLAIVSAVPNDASPGDTRATVETAIAGSRDEARCELERLAMLLGERVRADGGRVVDVEID